MNLPKYTKCGAHGVPQQLKQVRSRTDPPFHFLYDQSDLDMQSVEDVGLLEPVLTHLWHELTWKCCSSGDGLVVDIGANWGWYSLLSLALGCSVIAFEPVPAFHDVLRRGVAANPDFIGRAELHRKVVYPQPGNYTLRAVDRWGYLRVAADHARLRVAFNMAAQYDYKALMLSSVFSAAPAGNGLHSYRLAESIFLGAIPVIVDEKLVLPYCSVLDWSRFSVRVKRAQVPELPAILRAIPPAKVAAMQRRLAEVKERYFLYPFSTALALVRLRAARLRNATT